MDLFLILHEIHINRRSYYWGIRPLLEDRWGISKNSTMLQNNDDQRKRLLLSTAHGKFEEFLDVGMRS